MGFFGESNELVIKLIGKGRGLRILHSTLEKQNSTEELTLLDLKQRGHGILVLGKTMRSMEQKTAQKEICSCGELVWTKRQRQLSWERSVFVSMIC